MKKPCFYIYKFISINFGKQVILRQQHQQWQLILITSIVLLVNNKTGPIPSLSNSICFMCGMPFACFTSTNVCFTSTIYILLCYCTLLHDQWLHLEKRTEIFCNFFQFREKPQQKIANKCHFMICPVGNCKIFRGSQN